MKPIEDYLGTIAFIGHAHAMPAEEGRSDRSRELSPTGRNQMDYINSVLRRECHSFDLVVSSPAVRSDQTAILLPCSRPVRIIDSLFPKPPTSDDTLAGILQELDQTSLLQVLCDHPEIRPTLTELGQRLLSDVMSAIRECTGFCPYKYAIVGHGAYLQLLMHEFLISVGHEKESAEVKSSIINFDQGQGVIYAFNQKLKSYTHHRKIVHSLHHGWEYSTTSN